MSVVLPAARRPWPIFGLAARNFWNSAASAPERPPGPPLDIILPKTAFICASVTPSGRFTSLPRTIIVRFLGASGRPLRAPSDARLAVSPFAGVDARVTLSEAASWRCTSAGSSPSTEAAEATSRWVRRVELETARTSRRSPTWISTSAFIPGRSSPSRLAIRTMTGNIVTFWEDSAWGSILATVPSKGRLG